MIPLHPLLARLRRDPRFGAGRIGVGHLDHGCAALRHVAPHDLRRDPDNPSLPDLVDEDGVARSTPLPRIREVPRDGVPVWRHPDVAPPY